MRVNRPEIQDIDSAVYAVEQNQTIYNELDSKELKEVVSQLKPEQQTLIEMVYWGGYTHEEAAQRLEMPLGTVKNPCKKCSKRFKKNFWSMIDTKAYIESGVLEDYLWQRF
ncbi:MAG: sigma factor-like helix-turn-helix DNA-binding protein [Spirosomataceae bacterium]